MTDEKPTFRIITEELLSLPESAQSPPGADDNPYWLAEEPAPHPHPEKGCIQRGLCCKSSPGWFGPGEVEAAAALRDMSPDAFVKTYLIIDTVEIEGKSVHAFAPVKLDRFGEPAFATATVVDGLYRALRGTCVFYTGTGCGIYEARPLECATYICTNAPEDNLTHEAIGRRWMDDA